MFSFNSLFMPKLSDAKKDAIEFSVLVLLILIICKILF